MKKSTITNEMQEMILRGDSKAEIFAQLLQIFGVKYQNLISQIIHFDYDYLREKYDPERAIRRDISNLLEKYNTKGEIYEQLYKKYGHEKDSQITTVLEKDYDTLKLEQRDKEMAVNVNDRMDYTLFFNLNERLKVSNRQKYDYRLVKEFAYEDKTLVGEIEIKRGRLFIGAYSFEENLLLTAFNFITVLSTVFKDYFVISLSNMLSIEVQKRLKQDVIKETNSTVENRKILLKCAKGYQEKDELSDQYLLNIFYTIDAEMISMTIIGDKFEDTA